MGEMIWFYDDVDDPINGETDDMEEKTVGALMCWMDPCMFLWGKEQEKGEKKDRGKKVL